MNRTALLFALTIFMPNSAVAQQSDLMRIGQSGLSFFDGAVVLKDSPAYKILDITPDRSGYDVISTSCVLRVERSSVTYENADRRAIRELVSLLAGGARVDPFPLPGRAKGFRGQGRNGIVKLIYFQNHGQNFLVRKSCRGSAVRPTQSALDDKTFTPTIFPDDL